MSAERLLAQEQAMVNVFREHGMDKEDARLIVQALPHLIRTLNPAQESPRREAFFFRYNGERYVLRIEED
jgi:Flp pilus assembly secretin CpaC